jgi:glyoxylase-like metal-dependent hydrolase (beta-lactamase superfamily II)
VNGSSSDGVSFEWLFWIIETDGRTILVDTGFDDPDEAREWGIRQYVRPVERLAQFGISPLDVTDIIVTHLHWDHVGNAEAYPKATIWLQATEYEYAKSRLNLGNTRSKGMWWEHLQALLAAEAEGRLVLVNGEETMMTGITMTPAGGHTPGAQFVTVETLDGAVVIAGDETYLYRNNQSHIPIGSAYDHDANMAAIREMHRRAASTFLILPGHDPRVLSYFPEVSEGIVHVTTIPE